MTAGAGLDADKLGRVKLDHATLSRQIVDVVRKDILFGRLPAGTKLRQEQLCARFGVSRMPVRDALRQLMHEGLIDPHGSRSMVVAPVEGRDIADAFLIEGMLHGIAVRRVTDNMTDEWREELQRRHHDMDHCLDDLNRFAELDWSMHSWINKAAGSRTLIVSLRALARSIPHDFIAEHPEWIQRSNADHTEIVTAMTGGDGPRAETLTRRHVERSGRELIEYLAEHGVDIR